MSIVNVEHPYITKQADICGGRPVIHGTRIPVQSIVQYYKNGMSPEEILEGFPQLTFAQIFDALSYYHDHQEEIERDISYQVQLDEKQGK